MVTVTGHQLIVRQAQHRRPMRRRLTSCSTFSWASLAGSEIVGSVDSHVHPSAVIDEGARIGAGTRVWHHAHIRGGATVGRDCNLGKNTYVDAGALIGDRVKIQNNVSVYAGVELEDDVFVGPSAVFTNDRVPRASADHWQLAHTLVRQGASIGANATLVAGIVVGEWAMIAAGSVVTRSIAPHELVAGNPARRLGWVCRCGGVRLREDQPARLYCSECGTDTVPASSPSAGDP
jgi:UDP-2-acetamido-3-amino-2,3-dideoxy-glucuronate N-acetyltransferase